jgi:adenosylmethionine-8-amino-7-oxononanoate aminotransferase
MYKPLLFNSFLAPSPYCYRCEFGKIFPECSMACLERLEEILKTHANEIAAVICEPRIQAAAGIITTPEGFLRSVRELCDRFDVLLIADEVAVGFGRTGVMFACEAERVTPDLMALAKGLTGGYLPLAATLVTDRVFEAFHTRHEDRRTFYHGHTYTGNPLACAAAIANLDLFEEERTLERLAARIERLTRGLEKIAALDHVGDIRQRGVMVGIEIVKDKSTKELFDISEKIGVRICRQARQVGVIIRPLEHIVVLNPPLCIDDEQVDMLVEAVGKSIVEVI